VDYLLGVARCWENDLANLEAALSRIAHLPTLLIWGSKDRAVFPESAAHLRRRFAHAELLMMEGVGHLPYEEAPEEFNQALVRFLYET
jgi:pimeloyl-ACP methyl ester carboxylesterase